MDSNSMILSVLSILLYVGSCLFSIDIYMFGGIRHASLGISVVSRTLYSLVHWHWSVWASILLVWRTTLWFIDSMAL